MKLHSIEGKFKSSVFVSEEFLTIMRNLLYRDLTISSFDCTNCDILETLMVFSIIRVFNRKILFATPNDICIKALLHKR